MAEGKGEDPNKCCLCVPIKTGLQILSILSVACAILFIASAVLAILSLANLVPAILACIFNLPWLLVAWYMFKWLSNDNDLTRKNLTFGFLIIVIIGLLNVGLEVFNILTSKDGFNNALSTLIGSAIVMIINMYFYTIAKRYEAMGGTN